MLQIETALEEFQTRIRLVNIYNDYIYNQNFFYDHIDNTHSVKAYSYVNGVIDGITSMFYDSYEAEQIKEAFYEYLDSTLKAHFKLHSHDHSQS